MYFLGICVEVQRNKHTVQRMSALQTSATRITATMSMSIGQVTVEVEMEQTTIPPRSRFDLGMI